MMSARSLEMMTLEEAPEAHADKHTEQNDQRLNLRTNVNINCLHHHQPFNR
jgi:hypothetical protein